jgi:hypothetical protein
MWDPFSVEAPIEAPATPAFPEEILQDAFGE